MIGVKESGKRCVWKEKVSERNVVVVGCMWFGVGGGRE